MGKVCSFAARNIPALASVFTLKQHGAKDILNDSVQVYVDWLMNNVVQTI